MNQLPVDNKTNRLQAQISGAKKQTPSSSRLAQDNSFAPASNVPQHNCIFNIIYNGKPRQFALSGQLLSESENFTSIPPLG